MNTMKCPYSKRIITALAVIACTCGMNAEAASVGQLVASNSYNLYWSGSYNDVTKTGGSYNTALGGQTLAAATGSAAVGSGAVAAVENTVALGSGSRADREAGKDGYLKSAARTGAAWTSTANAISVGNVNGTDGSGNPAPVTRQITGIAAGSEDTDAVNVAQLKAAVAGASAVKAGSNISVSADNTVSLKDDVYLGGNHDAATSNIHLNGNDGTITANAKGGMFENSRTMEFNKDGLTVSGTDGFGNNTGKTTTVKDGVVRVSDKSLASEHYTEIDGGTVRTEILKVNPDTQSRLKFDGGGLATNVGDSALSVDKKYIYQAVDDGSGRSNSMKIEKTVTTFKAAGIASAGTTTIEGKKVTAGDVVINGETGQSTIKGLTNKTLTAPDFAKAGRAATEEQLKVTDDKVTVLDGRVGTLNTQVGALDTRVTSLDGRMDSVDAQIGTLSGRVNGVNDRINQLDGRINKVGAGAAALAALHPLDYDPAYKWDFAAGMGNYRNANAMAIGAFYRPNEVTMFSLGASIGDGGGMVNAGISLKVGPGVNGGTTRSGLMSKVQDLTAENKELKARDDAQDALINQLRRELEALKDDLHK